MQSLGKPVWLLLYGPTVPWRKGKVGYVKVD
jgi:hypothetical protein